MQLAADATLTDDIRVQKDRMLFIDGAGRTLVMREYQFSLEAGAKLCMYNINLMDGQVFFQSSVAFFVAQCEPGSPNSQLFALASSILWGVQTSAIAHCHDRHRQCRSASAMIDMGWVTVSGMKAVCV